MNKYEKPENPTIISYFKNKLLDIAMDYFKKNIESTKKDILKYIEKNIEKRIKKEIRKGVYTLSFIVLLVIGLSFIIYGIIDIIILLLNFPKEMTNIFFGLLLLLISLILYLMK